ncbi:carbamoyltransferase [Streptomyces sp. NPDC015127]|uniref:carbamoyltransferase family protein n=1 Tax=Streptomyces sp. NPDC015127 TaxID=3364939 RepID=UPI003702F256
MAEIVLGINAYHADSSACILVDGELVAAAEEERFRRQKHWAGVPTEAIRYCLREGGVGLGDVDHVAINRDPRSSFRKKVAYTLANRPSPRLVVERLRNARAWLDVEGMMRQAAELDGGHGGAFRGRIHRVEHHLAHLASAFYASPYTEAVAVSVDGFGDFASTAWGFGRGGDLSLDGRVYFPHSLGVFYQTITHYLGFHHYGDEYKVMGLAPYGEPAYVDHLRKVVLLEDDGTFRLDLGFFRHHRESTSYEWANQTPHADGMYSEALVDLLGPPRARHDDLTQRHRDIARSAQVVYEDAFFHLLNAVHRRYACDALVVAGGCGQNSVANGKIYERSPFRRAYMPPSQPDAGGAIGAAAHVWHRLHAGERATIGASAYLGPSFGQAEIAALLKAEAAALGGASVVRTANTAELCRRVADALAAGRVVGWFQGRMEWGPRALGNRSILGDPRRADMKQILNEKIKRRESFRPFAPSILRADVGEWFETDDDVPYMSKVFTIREEKRAQIPAVTHVDGTGRLQTVDASENPLYHELITAYRDLTGVPMVLNTSFNENEPIVCRPQEALDCFLRTNMDVLVMNEFLVERP